MKLRQGILDELTECCSLDDTKSCTVFDGRKWVQINIHYWLSVNFCLLPDSLVNSLISHPGASIQK